VAKKDFKRFFEKRGYVVGEIYEPDIPYYIIYIDNPNKARKYYKTLPESAKTKVEFRQLILRPGRIKRCLSTIQNLLKLKTKA